MGLEPLEFDECITDSPFFREKLHEHERELDKTSKQIKALISDGKELLNATKNLGRAQKSFAKKLVAFEIECIGERKTDDEVRVASSLKEFGRLMMRVEDSRERMVQVAEDQFKNLEKFRKEQLGSVKDMKKQFDKQTSKICQMLDKHLNMKLKNANPTMLQDADANLEMEIRGFRESSMNYVYKVQEVQERKKFDFVETILSIMYCLFTFYHEGFELNTELNDYSTHLQKTLQKMRDNFEQTKDCTMKIMYRTLENKGCAAEFMKPCSRSGMYASCTIQGYLFLMEKKALGISWNKHYCWYKKDKKEFHMIPYNQATGKLQTSTERFTLKQCTRRASNSIDKRFCFDLTFESAEKGSEEQMTFQAISDQERKNWMDAMDGKEPVYKQPQAVTEDTSLDEVGFSFMEKCLSTIEQRGLHDQGLYRVVGVSSKVNKLIAVAFDPKKQEKVCIEDPTQFEVKTITSAVKQYLRNLPEPLMTFKLHSSLIKAAMQEAKNLRILDIHTLVHQLPEANFRMLELLMGHLIRVSQHSDKNLMTVANLGVCFGPTLMRSEEETVAAIMDIKFMNIVVEILITNFDQIFHTPPESGICNPAMQTPTSTEGKKEETEKFVPVNNHVMAAPALAEQSTAKTHYANKGFRPYNTKIRAMEVFNPTTGGYETIGGSSSGSSESLNSSHSNYANLSSSSPLSGPRKVLAPPNYSNVNFSSGGRFLPAQWSSSDVPAFGSIKKRGSNDSHAHSMNSSMTGSITGSLTGAPARRTVRTLFHCEAENESELSFEPNEIITEVYPSKENGWLYGTLHNKQGLIPANYVEFLD